MLDSRIIVSVNLTATAVTFPNRPIKTSRTFREKSILQYYPFRNIVYITVPMANFISTALSLQAYTICSSAWIECCSNCLLTPSTYLLRYILSVESDGRRCQEQ